MKTLLAAILLATTAVAATAEPRSKQVKFVCASFEDLEATIERYGEKMVIATQAPNELTVNILYVNLETQTSSWILHDLRTDEYCMVGVGKAIHIPDDSPLKQDSVKGTRIIYK
jgi:hypothetical protein